MEAVQYRRVVESENLAVAAMEVSLNGSVGRLALLEDDVAGTKMQLTIGELKWLCFTAGPDILRTLEGE